MSTRFHGLNKAEQAAIAAYMRAEYDRLLSKRPATYVVQNAQTNPEYWQNALRELIAADPKRVQAIMESARCKATPSGGFTLIELSMVLVIIGLIVGGLLVGQNLIRAAEVRATVSQVGRYNTAVQSEYRQPRGSSGLYG